jgi:hypothetical protein
MVAGFTKYFQLLDADAFRFVEGVFENKSDELKRKTKKPQRRSCDF